MTRKKETKLIKKPVYEGGMKAMRTFVKKHLKYPKEALEQKVEGTVSVFYEINHHGDVINTRVQSGIGYGCDEEAQRIVRLFKFEIDDLPYRRKVKFNKTIRIHFRLPKKITKKTELPPKPSIKNTYSYTISTTKEKPAEKSKSKTFSYTISY